MRKRNCDKLFDNIMWYTIYLLPIVIAIVAIATNFRGDWYTLWQEIDGDFTNAPFFSALQTIFWHFGNFCSLPFISNVIFEIFALFDGDTDVIYNIIANYFAYFITVYMFHLFVDFILFIPRLAHKWLNHAYQGD